MTTPDPLRYALADAIAAGDRLVAVILGLELVLITNHWSEERAREIVDELVAHVGLPPRGYEPPQGYSQRSLLAGWKVPTT